MIRLRPGADAIRPVGFGIALAVVAGAVELLPLSDFQVGVVFSILFWAAAALAWNLSAGYAGDLSLGHGAFFGIGAYGSTLLLVQARLTPWLGLLVGMAVAVALSLVLGWIAIRLRGPFFAMVTLGLVEVMYLLATALPKLTNGASGISILAHASWSNFLFERQADYAVVAALFLYAAVLITWWITRRRIGYELLAYRENEAAARALGARTLRARLIALAISAALTAALGTLQAQYVQFLSPDSGFSLTYSIQVALIAIVGGLGTLGGPILGAVFIVPLGQILIPMLGHAGALNQLAYGVVLIAALLVFRGGLASAWQRLAADRGRSRPRRVRSEQPGPERP